MENSSLNKARLQRLEDFSRDYSKFAAAGAVGKFTPSGLRKIQRHMLPLQTMRNDKIFGTAAKSFLKVIDISAELIVATKAGDVGKVEKLGDEITDLFKTAEESVKNGL